MRSYTANYRKALVQGLRPRVELDLNTPFFSRLDGLKPSPNGLISDKGIIERLEMPQGRVSGDWPFPQLLPIVGDSAFSNGIEFTVDGTVSIANTDSLWHAAGLKSNWVAVSGSRVLFRRATVERIDQEVNSVCYSRGRFFFGGLSIQYLTPTLDPNLFHKSYVLWNPVGEPPALSPSDDLRWRHNEFGFQEISDSSEILAVLPFEGGVIAYGDGSISMLVPNNNLFQHVVLNRSSGIKSRNSVAGNSSEHLFVSSDGELIRVNSEGTRRLGYREYFNIETDWLVLVDDSLSENIYYITDGNICYVFDSNGLGSTKRLYTGISRGVGVYRTVADEPTVAITNPTDFGSRDRKTLVGIHCDAPGAMVRVIATSEGDNEITSDWVEINSVGFARPQITGIEFKVEISGATNISDLHMEFQNVGKRFRRGPVAGAFNQ